jgi:hypothetical protein
VLMIGERSLVDPGMGRGTRAAAPGGGAFRRAQRGRHRA